MNAKHTPGPWVVSDGNIVISDSHNTVAVPWDALGRRGRNYWDAGYGHISSRVTEVEAIANARLIACAPEMLEVLRELLPLIESTFPVQADTWLADARAVIAKATGDGR